MLVLRYIQNGIYHYRRFHMKDYNGNFTLALDAAIGAMPADYSYAEIRDRAGDLQYQSIQHEDFAEVICKE